MDESLRSRKRLKRYNAILDAFTGELASKDADRISIDEIAARVDVSRATIFNYFDAKRDIVFAIANREIDSLEELAESLAATDATPLAMIAEIAYRLVAVSFEAPMVAWRVLITVLEDPSRGDSPILRLSSMFEDLVRKGVDIGEFHADVEPGSCARSIVGTYFAELFHISKQPDPNVRVDREEFDAIAEQLVRKWVTTDE